MQSTIVRWSTIHQHGPLWWEHLKLRKRLFVDHNGWSIPHNTAAEWDQYDNANTIYVITHEDGMPISASRMNPCDFDCGGWSYMIRDAVLGRIDGIPKDILDAPPTCSKTWEATRFTVNPDLTSHQRNAALAENATALASAARQEGVERLIALMPPAYIRWLTKSGLPTRRIGPTKQDGDGKRICVMQMSVI